MEQPKIISIENRHWEHWYSRLVCNWIEYATKSPMVHTQMLIGSSIYELTIPKVKKTENYVFVKNDLNHIQEFTTQWTDKQIRGAVEWWEEQIRLDIKYGVLKLFFYILMRWSKPFWNKINWFPMAKNQQFGEFCSAAVSVCCKLQGFDFVKNSGEEAETPGDIYNSEILKEY